MMNIVAVFLTSSRGRSLILAMKFPEFLTRTGDDKCQLLFALPWNRVGLALTRMDTSREVIRGNILYYLVPFSDVVDKGYGYRQRRPSHRPSVAPSSALAEDERPFLEYVIGGCFGLSGD
jgi:hypothetical protein